MDTSREHPAAKVATAIVALGLILGLGLVAIALWRWADWSAFVASKYLIVGAILSLCSAAGLVFGAQARSLAAISLVTLGLCIYAADLAVAMGVLNKAGGKSRADIAKEMGRQWDERSKIEVMDDLRQQGRDAWPTVHPMEFHERPLQLEGGPVHPLGGIPGVDSVYCNEGGQYTVYPADEHGFNNPQGQHEAGADLVLVGDSFAHGACVLEGEDLGSQLRKHSSLRVLNLGYGGNGPLMSLAALTEYGQPHHPKHVVWVHYPANDLSDLKGEAGSSILRKYLEQDGLQGLVAQSATVAKALRAYASEREQAHRDRPKIKSGQRPKKPIRLKEVLSLYHLRKQFYLRPTANPNGLFKQVMRTAKERVESWGGQLHFVYLPVVPHYPLDARWRRDEILEIVSGLGIDLLDFQSTVEAMEDPLVCYNLRITGHFSSQGYELLAKGILQELSHQPAAAQP